MGRLRSLLLCLCLLAVCPPGRIVGSVQGPPTIAAASDLNSRSRRLRSRSPPRPGSASSWCSARREPRASGDGRRAVRAVPVRGRSVRRQAGRRGPHARSRALYAVGRIVLFAPRGIAAGVDERIEWPARADGAGAGSALQSPTRSMRPTDAPRRRCCERGLWDMLQPALVLGDNITQAAQFATPVTRSAESSPTRWCSRPPYGARHATH